MKKIFLFLIVFAVSSCGGGIGQDFSDFGGNMRRIASSYGEKVDRKISSSEIENSEFAYVVGRSNGRNEWLNINKSYKDSYGVNEVIELSHVRNFGATSYEIFKIEPGKYTLVFYSYQSGNTIYRSIDAGKDKNEEMKKTDSYYASFEVEKGKIYYLGDVNIGNNNKDMDISDNHTAAITYISKVYPNIENVATALKYTPVKKGEFFRK